MRDELATHAADVLTSTQAALDKAVADGPVRRIDDVAFAAVRSVSIDYAVMEHTTNAAVFGPLSCAWSDVGTWPAVGDLQIAGGSVQPVLIDAKNCTVHSEQGALIAALGVEDLVIAVHDGTVLVMSKSRAQDVSLVIEALKVRGLTDKF
mgnify:FL=1